MKEFGNDFRSVVRNDFIQNDYIKYWMKNALLLHRRA